METYRAGLELEPDNQRVRESLLMLEEWRRAGINFRIMLVGESGLGKTSACERPFAQWREAPAAAGGDGGLLRSTTAIDSSRVFTRACGRGVRLRVQPPRRVRERGALARTVVGPEGGHPGGVIAANPGPLGATGSASSDPMNMNSNPILLSSSSFKPSSAIFGWSSP